MMRQSELSANFSRGIAGQYLAVGVVACLVLTTLSGCMIPQLCCADPPQSIPEDFYGKTSAENSAQVGVYDFFTDPALAQLIANALATNQELKIRNQEVQKARNEILARRGSYLPFVTLGAKGGMDRTSRYTPLGAAEDQLFYPGGGSFPDPLGNVGLTANLFWRIDIWRELRNGRDAAIQRYGEAIDMRDFFVTKLVADIADNYYELVALDQRIIYLDQTIAIQKRSLEVAKFQLANAAGTELAVQRFTAEVAKNESQKLIIRQSIIEFENRINLLVGRFPQPVQRAAWAFIDLDSNILNVGVPAQLLLNRRDIRAAEREIAASGLDVLVARAHFFPTLDITARVGYEAFNPRYLFDPGAFIANAAGELVGPLINKRAIRAEYMSANARQLQAVYDYQRTVITAFTEVINSMAKVENYRNSVRIKQQQVEALNKSVDVATTLFQNVRAEYIDVLFAQRDLLEARTVLLETKQQQLAAIVNAYQALGGGYLLTNNGMTYKDIRCMRTPYLPGEQIDAPEPEDKSMEPAVPDAKSLPKPPNGDMLSPTSLDSVLTPSPSDVSMQPAEDTMYRLPILE
ncbi:efflux transporter outer membrane subunit [bacterium]|nr:efflux transporter outer membrane subunit [bacterium]